MLVGILRPGRPWLTVHFLSCTYGGSETLTDEGILLAAGCRMLAEAQRRFPEHATYEHLGQQFHL